MIRNFATPISTSNTWLSQQHEQQPQANFPAELFVKERFLRIMAAHIRVFPSEHEFFLEGNDSILEAALRAGLALNYGCSNGNCGLCKAKILSGQVKKIRPHDYVISVAEKAQGYALLCSTTAVTGLAIEALEADGVRDILVATH